MSIFKLSTGKQVEAKEEAELGGGSEPIPEGTKVKAGITEIKWDKYTQGDNEGESYINARWDVVEGQFKNRVIFQKIRVYQSDEKKADKHRTMLATIDFNAGGKLQALESDEPTDMELSKCLCNKVMELRLGVWETEDKSASGNWVQAIGSGKSQSKTATKKEEFDADLPDF